MKEEEMELDLLQVGKWVLYLSIGLGIFVFMNPIVIVNAGERGVLLRFGEVQPNIFSEGLHFRIPIMETVVIMDVKTQKYETEATAASKDLQDTKTTVALNYHLAPETVNRLYQTIGLDYGNRIIAPAIQEVVKASTARYNAEQLITERPLVKESIEEGLKARLNERGMLVETVSITNFEFSKQFTEAIEQKVTAQQLALKAENDLKRIEIEAKQAVAKAEGDAKAIEIIQNQLEKAPKYVEYIAVQKWNGVMPLVTGSGAMPLISVPVGTSQ